MSALSYKDYVKKLADAFGAKLVSIEATYNFDHGPEFEVVLCEALAAILPDRFGVCRGFVVDKDSHYAGDDIIIFDQQNFPLLRLREHRDFSRKQYVPIEAVYAYIEAKHTIEVDGTDGQSLKTSIEQVVKVKELCNRREKTDLAQSDPYFSPPFSVENPTVPRFRNPVFGVVFGRFVRARNRSRIEDPGEIHRSFPSVLSFAGYNVA